jgi:hypothetical protein
MKFYGSIIVFIIINIFGFIFANIKYEWIGLKECGND